MPKRTNATTKPLSVRFTDEERTALTNAAGQMSLSAYVRQCALSAAGKRLRRKKDDYTPSKTCMQLAQILALLGQSNIFAALKDMLELARLGALPVTDETEENINAACADIASIKTMLIKALGMKGE